MLITCYFGWFGDFLIVLIGSLYLEGQRPIYEQSPTCVRVSSIDLRRISLVPMHILIQHHLHPSLHSHTRYQTVLRLIMQVHMQQWQLNMVPLLQDYTIATPLTASHISLNYIITTHPGVLSQLQCCVNTMQTPIAIVSMEKENVWRQPSSPLYEITLQWYKMEPVV